jgi:hypothetical protein
MCYVVGIDPNSVETKEKRPGNKFLRRLSTSVRKSFSSQSQSQGVENKDSTCSREEGKGKETERAQEEEQVGESKMIVEDIDPEEVDRVGATVNKKGKGKERIVSRERRAIKIRLQVRATSCPIH